MTDNQNGRDPASTRPPRLLAYVADLEMEVDRLRRNNRLVHEAMRAAVADLQERLTQPGGDPSQVLGKAAQSAQHLGETLRALRDPPGYHPAYDQVVPIAVRPLIEQLFRWHGRLLGTDSVTLVLELESEHIDWFPARLRNILDNLLSNAMKYRDPQKTESWVRVKLSVLPETYEFHITDNGVGLAAAERDRAFDLVFRTASGRAAGVGVGIPVVKLLLEQTGGTVTVDAGEGQGTSFLVVLPRYEIDDFLV